MSSWLFKSDPDTYSWHDLVKDQKTMWDGVANNLALKHLRSIKKGDEIFIYHSGEEKSLVGIAKALSDSYPDPSQKNSKLAVVDIMPVKTLKNPVTLQTIRQNARFADWELVRMSRLSVMPVNKAVRTEIAKLAGNFQ